MGNSTSTIDVSSGPFDFNRYSWPPSGEISITRFTTSHEYLGSGSFRAVYLAKDNVTNQLVVAKKFRDSSPMEDRFWSEDIHASREAQRFARLFNQEMKSSKPLRFILPIIDKCTQNIGGSFRSGEKVLIEPFLGKNVYQKFNSNSGWENKQCGFSMGAFSHFTYHSSGGTMLVCDLQGIKNGDGYILTDPVICSVKQSFGVTDLGEEGIRSFFACHDCTDLCKKTWRKHGSPKSYAKGVIIGTTFSF